MIVAMEPSIVFHQLAAAAAHGELAFSTGTQVALRIQQALADPACHVDAAARLIQAEPLLAARMVGMANSAAFNPYGREVSDVRTAVSRLGFHNVRALATALATRQMASQSPQAAMRSLAEQLWRHTAEVTALAQVIARRVTGQDPETALFAALMHEVGGFYLLARAHEYPGLLDDDLSGWIEEGEVEVGRAVLRVLGVPGGVMDGIEAYWQGYLSLPAVSLGDTLLLADELAHTASPLRQLAGEHAAADARIDMAIGDDSLAHILAESKADLASLQQMLAG
jgi:HD-like signal output (HDOD) protein